jgi:adenylate cyclase
MSEDLTTLQSGKMLELVFEDGGVTYRVQVRDGLTLGRASDNDVVLRDFSVSRHHARIDEKDGGFHLVDLGSTNGIRVNESFVASGAFTVGDLVGVGSFELRVESADDEAGGLSSATYLRPLSEFNQDYGLEGQPQEISKELGPRERVFEILAQVAKVLIQVEELEPVLEKVMDLVFDQLMVDRGFIVLFDAEGAPQLELNRVRESEACEETEVPISRTILDTVSQQKVAILTHDAQADHRFEAGRSVRIHQIRSAMCAPLWHREKVIGVIYVDSPLHVGSFSTSDLDLLTALSNYAAVAIERARLNEHIRRERVARDRLERYHSPAVIEAVLSDSGAERSVVTLSETSILFADIVGFTSRCETQPPEDVAAFLNQFFSLAADIIFTHGGTLDKFIGDAVMAFFGAPLPQDDHAVRAVQSALELLTALENWNTEREAAGDDRIDVRIAVNSGPVVVGDIGSASRVDYTVLGNTVNVAARLEEHVAKPGMVVLGETTQAAIAGAFPTEPLGSVQLKGLRRKIDIYRLAVEKIENSGTMV